MRICVQSKVTLTLRDVLPPRKPAYTGMQRCCFRSGLSVVYVVAGGAESGLCRPAAAQGRGYSGAAVGRSDPVTATGPWPISLPVGNLRCRNLSP